MWNEFWKAFNEATDTGFHKQSPFQDDYAFYRELRYNNAVFAAFKAHRFQNDIASQLLDEDGQLKPFDIFKRDVEKFVSPLHLESWLQTEYATAVIRAHQASDWRRFERDKDVLPRLRWVESTSVHPGEDHRVFWGYNPFDRRSFLVGTSSRRQVELQMQPGSDGRGGNGYP